MRDVVQEILHGVASQTLILDAPEGRPSSITSVTVLEHEDDDDAPARPAITGSPSIETNPDTTVATSAAGASQADPKAITLALGTNVARRRPYILESGTTGDQEWIEFVYFSGVSGVLRQPLLADYPIGSTLKSTRMSVGIDTTWISDKSNLSSEEEIHARYRVSWLYVVNGATVRRQTQFDVVRYTAVHHVTPPDVDNRFPGWMDRLPVDYRREQGKPLIDQAFRALKMDLRAEGKHARWLRNIDVVTELVICRANHMATELAALRGQLAADVVSTAANIYKQRYEQLIREPHTITGATPMGGERDIDRAPLFRR
jgi:hypothetical protein